MFEPTNKGLNRKKRIKNNKGKKKMRDLILHDII